MAARVINANTEKELKKMIYRAAVEVNKNGPCIFIADTFRYRSDALFKLIEQTNLTLVDVLSISTSSLESLSLR